MFDGDKPVGTIAAYSLQMTLPGGLRPLAGVSQVSVQPTHRRRGIMRAMMTQGLHDLHTRGDEAVAALWATEGSIYGRFGFGVASTSFTTTIRRGEGAFLPGVDDRAGTFEMLEAEDALPMVMQVFDSQLPEQVGAVARDEVWWRARIFDPSHIRGKAGPLLTVIHRDDAGELDGYALYRTEPRWEGANPDGRVEVKEIVGRTPVGDRGAVALPARHRPGGRDLLLERRAGRPAAAPDGRPPPGPGHQPRRAQRPARRRGPRADRAQLPGRGRRGARRLRPHLRLERRHLAGPDRAPRGPAASGPTAAPT